MVSYEILKAKCENCGRIFDPACNNIDIKSVKCPSCDNVGEFRVLGWTYNTNSLNPLTPPAGKEEG